MKKILTLALLAASIQAALPAQSQAGLILVAAGGNGGVGNIGSAAVATGLVAGVIGYAVGCDESVTHYRRVPVYDRYGRRIGWRREETTQCIVWNSNPTASTLLWTGLGLIILDAEVSRDSDALDSTLSQSFSFIDSRDAIESLADAARAKAAAVFASGHTTAIVSMTEAEVRAALEESALTEAQILEVASALK